MDVYQEVLFEEMPGKGGNLGIITLNRPNVLNALNLTMIEAMSDRLNKWANAAHIKAVIIKAAQGRAFCAGGDLRLTYDKYKANDPSLSAFFYNEYQLNRLIFHFPKPYIAFLNGITMGGGVGISLHGSHRVATHHLSFAMPETGIGFFPDVGGSYFLPRLPGFFGFYAGLTGVRIESDDCVALGIATHKVLPEVLPDLITALLNESFNAIEAKEKVTRIINQFALAKTYAPDEARRSIIDHSFSHSSMEEIVEALQRSSNPFCEETLRMLLKKSPTSLKITLHALQLGRNLNFDDCMKQEYRLVSRFLQGHDFFEGIRALIIDKDQQPRWQPNKLAEVSSQVIEKYFAPLAHELA